MLSRRGLLAILGSTALSSHIAPRLGLATTPMPISDEPPRLDDAALERIFLDNSEPFEGDYVIKGLAGNKHKQWPYWWEYDPPEMAKWPPDHRTIDYAHLPSDIGNDSFQLNDTALRRIVASHSYSPFIDQDLVLFGIRGACIVDETASEPRFKQSISLVETRPNHFDYRCLLGVWNTADRTIWVTPGSTTPHVAYLYAQREASTWSWEANMMPTGLYHYRVGTHRNGTKSFQPGAFRPDDPAFAVLRYVKDGTITMSSDQYWDTRPANHGDNIHAGTYTTREDRPKYWSAGCQVVPGHYEEDNTRPEGNWARFRVAAGLLRSPQITRRDPVYDRSNSMVGYNVATTEDGRKYSYLLTTGRDILLANQDRAVPALRFGSSGSKVRALQTALGLPTSQQDGIFGIVLQRTLLETGETNTPVVDTRLARRLGISL